ncbi:hypothetical protein PC9H_008267 [Pleurotus ostreatus]|uniref:Uncharacterized protein n=1 Tax=Pleurotus ostreatus TaxID=5322 RepID=A0A8H6ZVT5_PLEOS|nr:uncharacterized protein PC9H_008267 [Pleurotus ostreatus]KAF7429029.1 hypothetical protein PC9H_008267 [Pleurotus ostreatus]
MSLSSLRTLAASNPAPPTTLMSTSPTKDAGMPTPTCAPCLPEPVSLRLVVASRGFEGALRSVRKGEVGDEDVEVARKNGEALTNQLPHPPSQPADAETLTMRFLVNTEAPSTAVPRSGARAWSIAHARAVFIPTIHTRTFVRSFPVAHSTSSSAVLRPPFLRLLDPLFLPLSPFVLVFPSPSPWASSLLF